MSRIQKTALAITRWVGSPASVVVHTLAFIASFWGVFMGWFPFEEMLLILTTIVSLEAIYLSIFIQMTINYTTQEIEDISEDIEEIQEDVGELQEDVGEMQEDVGELQEDVEEMAEEEKTEEQMEEQRKKEQRETLVDIQADVHRLLEDIERWKKNQESSQK